MADKRKVNTEHLVGKRVRWTGNSDIRGTVTQAEGGVVSVRFFNPHTGASGVDNSRSEEFETNWRTTP